MDVAEYFGEISAILWRVLYNEGMRKSNGDLIIFRSYIVFNAPKHRTYLTIFSNQ
jgi:hypothetical protein